MLHLVQKGSGSFAKKQEIIWPDSNHKECTGDRILILGISHTEVSLSVDQFLTLIGGDCSLFWNAEPFLFYCFSEEHGGLDAKPLSEHLHYDNSPAEQQLSDQESRCTNSNKANKNKK